MSLVVEWRFLWFLWLLALALALALEGLLLLRPPAALELLPLPGQDPAHTLQILHELVLGEERVHRQLGRLWRRLHRLIPGRLAGLLVQLDEGVLNCCSRFSISGSGTTLKLGRPEDCRRLVALMAISTLQSTRPAEVRMRLRSADMALSACRLT